MWLWRSAMAVVDIVLVKWLADTEDAFYKHELTLIPPWISNHMLTNVWVEIT